MISISPSLLAADFSDLKNEVKKVADAGADWLHLDVMDGAFVPNMSFGAPVITAIRPHSNLFFDVHLMINEPIRYIDDFAKAGADLITVHLESTNDLDATLDKIREKKVRIGLSISPATPVEKMLPYLEKVDLALIMTVVPGFGGQSFMPDMLEKVRTVRRYAKEHGLNLDIEVDGGLNAKNTPDAVEAGANVIVAGSAIFRSEDPAAVISAMKSCEK